MRSHLAFAARVILAAWFVCGVSTSGRAADQPNMILIFTDDQAAKMTGFEGHPLIKTPNLDRLAAEGVYFTRCYVPTPQCAPSRACVLTGRYPHSNGVTWDGDDNEPMALSLNADTFTARLKKAGYVCGIVGEWHLPYATSKSPGFGLVDYVATDDGSNWKWDNCPVWVQGEKKTADKFLTDWHGDRAIEFIEKSHGKPFFLWLCFRAPHEPLVEPPGMANMYPPESVDLPATMKMDEKSRPNSLAQAEAVRIGKTKKEQDLRRDRSKYYAMITRMDENVGRVLKRLDELGLGDDTVVAFASDNGWCLGDHGLYSNGPFFYEELIRGPLLVRYPKLTKPGTRIEHIVGLVDLAPTFLELAGLTPPITMQGRSLLPLIRNPEAPGHADEQFLEYYKHEGKDYRARGIVTKRYKFIDYVYEDVLFDLGQDPQETKNVINDPHYAGVLKTLQNRLKSWREQTKDPLLKSAS